MRTTKTLTWQHTGGAEAAKETVTLGAGEDVLFSLSPSAVTTGANRSLAGRNIQIVIAETLDDPALVSLYGDDYAVVDSDLGTFTVSMESVASLALPSNTYIGEVRDVATGSNVVLRRFLAKIAGNPLAAGEAEPAPSGMVSWNQITGTPTTLAGYGITNFYDIDGGDAGADLDGGDTIDGGGA